MILDLNKNNIKTNGIDVLIFVIKNLKNIKCVKLYLLWNIYNDKILNKKNEKERLFLNNYIE